MPRIFDRRFVLDVGAKRFQTFEGRAALHIAFAVEKDTKPEPNNVEIRLFNLAEETRDDLEKLKTVPVRLICGYAERSDLLFAGGLRKVESVRTPPKWETILSSGDGEDQIRKSRIRETFSKGTPKRLVLQRLIKNMGLGLGNFDAIVTPEDFPKYGEVLRFGQTISGNVAEELTQYARSLGLSWSIQDETMRLAFGAEPSDKAQGPRLTPDTGLIESPKLDSKGKLIGKCFLEPGLVPGRAFFVESEKISGFFKCEKVKHAGDSRAASWHSEFKAAQL